MRKRSANSWLTFLVSCTLALNAPDTVKAEDRQVSAGAELATLTKPKSWREEDHFYREYVAPLDARILREYRDRWDYHDQQLPYASTSWNHEHLSIGSLDSYDRAPFEGDVRRGFAGEVLRMRIDAAIKKYFSEPERARSLRKAHDSFRRVTNKINNVPLRLSPESRNEIRMGYDISSDSSRVEYITGDVTAGVYHPRLLGAITGGSSMNELSMRVTSQPGLGFPQVFLNLRWFAGEVDTGLRKPLSSSVSTELASTYSAKTLAPQQCNVRFEYRF